MTVAIGLQGVSRESFAEARENLDALVRARGTDLSSVSDELFAVGALLDREPGLRRGLTDPARSGDDRAELARSVLGEQVSDTTLDLVVATVRARWARARDLADSLELLGVESLVAAAEKAKRLDTLEDELFRISRIVSGTSELAAGLADVAIPAERRFELIESLLEGKVADETLRLVRQAVVAGRGRTFDRTLEEYAEVAADRRSRLVATVTAAVPLTQAQRRRLADALGAIYGHEVHLNIEVQPSIVGGIRVEIGDEVIDGSVLTRLDGARRRLSG